MSVNVMNQGENYEEDDTAEEYESESGEDTDSKLNTLFGIPVKFLIIGGAGLLLVLIFVIVISFRTGSDGDEIIYPDSNPVQQTTVQQTTYDWYANGVYVGSSLGSDDGTMIMNNGAAVGFILSTGTVPITANGLSTFYNPVEPVAEQPSTNPVGDPNASTQQPQLGTEDIKVTLRKLGYTGDEIEAAIASGADLEAMITAAEELHDAAAQEALVRMSDSASEEFQHMLNYSIFCLPYIEFPETENSFDRVMQNGNFIVNADYEKLDTYGNQLYIKLKIANNTYAYMIMTPQRWDAIPASGNMVVRVEYTLWGMKDQQVEFYITNLTELDVAQVTVNPEDSSKNIDEIINLGGTQ